jgi:hypothetical protein
LNPGLPDGLFSNQKSQFGLILEGSRLENVNIFYAHLEYFTDIWDLRFPSVEDSPEPSIAITGSQMSANPSMAMANGGKSSYLGTVYFLAKISVTMCTHLKLQ